VFDVSFLSAIDPVPPSGAPAGAPDGAQPSAPPAADEFFALLAAFGGASDAASIEFAGDVAPDLAPPAIVLTPVDDDVAPAPVVAAPIAFDWWQPGVDVDAGVADDDVEITGIGVAAPAARESRDVQSVDAGKQSARSSSSDPTDGSPVVVTIPVEAGPPAPVEIKATGASVEPASTGGDDTAADKRAGDRVVPVVVERPRTQVAHVDAGCGKTVPAKLAEENELPAPVESNDVAEAKPEQPAKVQVDRAPEPQAATAGSVRVEVGMKTSPVPPLDKAQLIYAKPPAGEPEPQQKPAPEAEPLPIATSANAQTTTTTEKTVPIVVNQPQTTSGSFQSDNNGERSRDDAERRHTLADRVVEVLPRGENGQTLMTHAPATTSFASTLGFVQHTTLGVVHDAAHGVLKATTPTATDALSLGEPVSSPSAESLSQLVRSIRLQWTQGGGDAVIRLEPRHFGDVRVALRVDPGQVTARLNVEAPAAREWLQNNQTWLRGSLSDHGLTLSRLEVTEPANESFDHGRRQTDREAAREKSQDQGHRRPRKPSTGERFETFV
jgi:hypothetical protein